MNPDGLLIEYAGVENAFAKYSFDSLDKLQISVVRIVLERCKTHQTTITSDNHSVVEDVLMSLSW